MIWVLYALLTAFFESFKDIFTKKTLTQLDVYVVSWYWRFFTFIFLLPLLFFIQVPTILPGFWKALLISGSLNVVTTILFMKAIRDSDLSLTIPLVTFTPAFLLLTSPFIVGEFPRLLGIFGVLLIVLGSYVLNIKQRNNGFFAPFKAFYTERGPRLMLIVAFLWSITSSFDKVGVKSSSALFWTLSLNFVLAVILLPFFLHRSGGHFPVVRTHLWALLLVGLLSALASLFQMMAINLTLVAYVISIKRVSAVLSVVWGALIFREKGFKERFIAVIIMVTGVVLIIWS